VLTLEQELNGHLNKDCQHVVGRCPRGGNECILQEEGVKDMTYPQLINHLEHERMQDDFQVMMDHVPKVMQELKDDKDNANGGRRKQLNAMLFSPHTVHDDRFVVFVNQLRDDYNAPRDPVLNSWTFMRDVRVRDAGEEDGLGGVCGCE